MRCICVLGMHRSGTSCLTGIMQGLGVELGEVFTANPFNKRGNRENARIMQLNDEILEFNGGAWDKPVQVQAWNDAHRRERDAIVREIQDRAGQFWGFKDPRTLLTLPFWLEAGIDPLFIATLRQPLRVALSLHDRNKMPLEQGLQLWQAYNQRLLALWTARPFPLIDFDLEPVPYLAAVVAGLLSLGLDPELADQATGFFSQDLRAQILVDVGDSPLPPGILDLYLRLRECSGRS